MLSYYTIGALICFVLYILSKVQILFYPEDFDFRYKSYGFNRTTTWTYSSRCHDQGNCNLSPQPTQVNNIETIVLIPGLDGATSFFSDSLPELTVEFQVIVFNLPLRKRLDSEQNYTFSFMAWELKKVIDELNLKQVHIVGESFGGVVAQHFAMDYPDCVKSLSLLSSLAKTNLPPEIQWKLDHLFPLVVNLGRYFPSLAQWIFAYIHVDDVLEKSEPNYAKQMFIKEASFAHFYSVMARIKLVSKLDIVQAVRTGISSPVLLVYGEEDHFTKKDSLALYALLTARDGAGCELVGMPGGHLPHLTSPRLFADIIMKFVRRHSQ